MKTIRQRVEESLQHQQNCLKYYTLVFDVLGQKWVGKKITRRLITDVAAQLPEGASVTMPDGGSLRQSWIRIYGVEGFPDYDNKIEFFLGYTNSLCGANQLENYSIQSFVDHNEGRGKHSEKEIARLNAILATNAPEEQEEALKELAHVISIHSDMLERNYPAQGYARELGIDYLGFKHTTLISKKG